MYSNINKFIKKILINKNKEKRKFLVAGILNVLLTNVFLQTFLFLDIFGISISTFVSQFINMTIGYAIYSKFIYKVKNSRNNKLIFQHLLRYLFLQ